MRKLVALFLVCLGLALPVLAQDDSPDSDDDGAGFLERQIQNALSGAGRDVTVRGFEGALSSRATLARMTIADEEGVWLTLENAVLDWNRSALLRGRLEVEELSAETLIVARKPVPDDSVDLPTPEATPFSLPDLPVSVNIGKLAIERAELGEPLFGQAAVVSLDGSVSLAGGEGEADIEVDRVDGQTGRINLDASYSNDSKELSIDLTAEEGPEGIIASILNIPDRPSLSASVQGSGPLSDFSAEINVDTDGEDRLSGTVEVSSTGEGDDAARGFAIDLGGDLAPVLAPDYRPFFGPDIQLRASGQSYADGRVDVESLSLKARSIALDGSLSLGADGLPRGIALKGEIAAPDGGPVVLPFGGGETRVQRVGIDIGYDPGQGEDWGGEIVIEQLSRPTMDIETLTLNGSGQIVVEEGRQAVSAELDYAAEGVAFADAGLQQALGETLDGAARILWQQQQPVSLESLTVNGAGFALDGSGLVDAVSSPPTARLTAKLTAEDLDRFSTLAGQDLAGAADVSLDASVGLSDASFDLDVEGSTTDLAVGVERLDALISGRTELVLRAARDETGTRLEQLRLGNERIALTGTADLKSQDSTAHAELVLPDTGVVDASLGGEARVEFDATQTEQAWSFDLAGSGLATDLQATGSYFTATEVPRVVANLSLNARELEQFAKLTGLPLGGSIDARIEGDALTDGSLFDLQVEGTTQSLQVGVEAADNLLQGETAIDVAAARQGANAPVTISALRVENPQLSLTGQGQFALEGSTGQFNLEIAELSEIVEGLDGPVSADLTAGEIEGGWQLNLDAEAMNAVLQGQADVTEAESGTPLIDGSATLEAQNLGRFSPLAGRSLGGAVDLRVEGRARADASSFDVSVNGTTQSVQVGISQVDGLLQGATDLVARARRSAADQPIEIESLSLENPQASLSAEGRYGAGQSDLSGTLRLTELSEIQPELAGAASADFDAEEIEGGWRVALDAEAMQAAIEAAADITEIDSGTPLIDGEASLQTSALSRFAGIAGRPLAGSANLRVEGRARSDASSFDLTVDGATTAIEVGIPQVDALMRGRTGIAVSASRDGEDGVIEVPRFRIENPQITASGEGSYGTGSSTVTADIRVAELSDIDPALSGSANVDLDAEETGEGWQVTLDANAADAVLQGSAAITEIASGAPFIDGEASLKADDLSRLAPLVGRPLDGAVDLQIDGAAKTDASRFDLKVNGTTQSVVVGIPQVDNLMQGRTELAVDAARDPGEGIIRVERLDLTNPQIRVTGRGVYGTGSGQVTADIVVGDLSRIDPELAGRGVVNLDADEGEQGWQVRLDADAAGAVVSAEAAISDIASGSPLIDGDATVRAEDLSRFASLVGRPLRGSVDARVSGQARTDASRFDVTADISAQGLQVGQADADRILAGSTQIDVDAAREGPDAPIMVDRLVVDTATLDANASGRIGGGESSLGIEARLADIAPYAAGISGPVSVRGTVGEAPGGYSLDLDADGPGGTQLAATGTVAEDFGTMDVGVRGSAPLGLANRFIEPRSLAGTVNFDLRLDGAPGLSALSGNLQTGGGARLVAPNLGLVLNDLNLRADISGGTARLSGSASKQQGGSLSIDGPVQLSGGYDADLTVALNGLVVENPSLYRTSLGGSVTVDGPLAGGARIGGRIELGETELRVPSTGLGATGPIPDNITHLNEPADVRATRRRAGLIEEARSQGGGSSGGGGVAYPLDITISAPNRIFVRGRGLDAELGGELTIEGTTANAIPAGEFDLIRGRLDILGQRLNLVDGSVTLQGDFSPVIRLVAETEAGDETTVQIIVEGTATSPEIHFQSQPELPEEEVLSRLLFGRSLQNISPLQAAQLASAVATLAGRGGDGVIGKLREGFGLDDLDITTTDEGNAAVRAGAYLSENIYSDVTVDSEGSAEVNLNLDLSKSVTVTGSANNDGETSLGIFYERDY